MKLFKEIFMNQKGWAVSRDGNKTEMLYNFYLQNRRKYASPFFTREVDAIKWFNDKVLKNHEKSRFTLYEIYNDTLGMFEKQGKQIAEIMKKANETKVINQKDLDLLIKIAEMNGKNKKGIMIVLEKYGIQVNNSVKEGYTGGYNQCEKCGSKNLTTGHDPLGEDKVKHWYHRCLDCGHKHYIQNKINEEEFDDFEDEESEETKQIKSLPENIRILFENCLKTHKRDKTVESYIFKKRMDVLLVAYARDILQNRWPEAEPIIKKNSISAVNYAMGVIKDRWPEAEKIINGDFIALAIYEHFLDKKYKNKEQLDSERTQRKLALDKMLGFDSSMGGLNEMSTVGGIAGFNGPMTNKIIRKKKRNSLKKSNRKDGYMEVK